MSWRTVGIALAVWLVGSFPLALLVAAIFHNGDDRP